MNIPKSTKVFKPGQKSRIVSQIKSRVRPMEFSLDAYLPEHYKNSIGSTRRSVMVRFGVNGIEKNLA